MVYCGVYEIMLLARSLYLKMLKFESKSGHYIFVIARYRSNALAEVFSKCFEFLFIALLNNWPKIFAQHCRFITRTSTVVAFHFHLVLPKSILFSGLVINKKIHVWKRNSVITNEGAVCYVYVHMCCFSNV